MNILLTILIKFSDRGREKERDGVTHLITNYPSSTRTNGNYSPREGGRRYLSERNGDPITRIRYRKNRGTISRELARPRIMNGTLIRLAFCTCSRRSAWFDKLGGRRCRYRFAVHARVPSRTRASFTFHCYRYSFRQRSTKSIALARSYTMPGDRERYARTR